MQGCLFLTTYYSRLNHDQEDNHIVLNVSSERGDAGHIKRLEQVLLRAMRVTKIIHFSRILSM